MISPRFLVLFALLVLAAEVCGGVGGFPLKPEGKDLALTPTASYWHQRRFLCGLLWSFLLELFAVKMMG
jgi:hypothetical protein